MAESTKDDISFLHQLWTNPEVMRFVGFPDGLRISQDEIKTQLEQYATQFGSGEFDRVLLACLNPSNDPIGECKLGAPDETGMAKTDVKLLPKFHGQAFGKEVKGALCDYLFIHTDCHSIKAGPNKQNVASIKMQEAVGGRRVGEGIHRFPDKMKSYTCDVPYYDYVVTREVWEKRQ